MHSELSGAAPTLTDAVDALLATAGQIATERTTDRQRINVLLDAIVHSRSGKRAHTASECIIKDRQRNRPGTQASAQQEGVRISLLQVR